MNNMDILEKNRKAIPEDEGMVYQENRARSVGVSCMIILIAALIIYNLTKGISSYSLRSVLWAYIGIEALFKYRHSKSKTFLITGFAGIITSVFSVASYFMETW